jgi:hypothetical protein
MEREAQTSATATPAGAPKSDHTRVSRANALARKTYWDGSGSGTTKIMVGAGACRVVLPWEYSEGVMGCAAH